MLFLKWFVIALLLAVALCFEDTNVWTSSNSNSECWNGITSSSDGQYVAAGACLGGAIYISSNYGVDWVASSAPTSGFNWMALACNSSGALVVAASNAGGGSGAMYMSTDYGSTWSITSAPSNQYWSGLASSSSGQYLFAVSNINGAIYTSSDYGTSWSEVSTTSEYYNSVAASSSGQFVIVVVGGGGIYLSSNYGQDFSLSSAASLDYKWVCSSSSGQYLVTAIYNGGIYYSVDFGVSWQQSNAPDETWQVVSSSANGQFVAGAVGADAAGIYLSNDYGATWYLSNAQVGQYNAMVSTASGDRIYGAEYNGIVYIGTVQTTSSSPTISSSPTPKPTYTITNSPTMYPTRNPSINGYTSYVRLVYYEDSSCSIYAGEQGFAGIYCYATYDGYYAILTGEEYFYEPDQMTMYIQYYSDSQCVIPTGITSSTVYMTTCTEVTVGGENAGYYYMASYVYQMPDVFDGDGALTAIYSSVDTCYEYEDKQYPTWYQYEVFNSKVCLPYTDAKYVQTDSCGVYIYCDPGQDYVYGDLEVEENTCYTSTSYNYYSGAVGYSKMTCYSDGGTVGSDDGQASIDSSGGNGSSSSTTAIAVSVPIVVILIFGAAFAYYYFVVNGGSLTHNTGPLASKAEDKNAVEVSDNKPTTDVQQLSNTVKPPLV